MSFSVKPLINSKFASSAGATEYTAPDGTTQLSAIIDKFTATNTDDASARTITVAIVPRTGSSSSMSTRIVYQKSIAAKATADLTELVNQILVHGDSLWVQADADSKVVIRASGREVS